MVDVFFFERLCHSMWLFHLHSMVKIQPFSPVFPLAESTAKVFCRLFLWNFEEKSINHFLWYSLLKFQRNNQQNVPIIKPISEKIWVKVFIFNILKNNNILWQSLYKKLSLPALPAKLRRMERRRERSPFRSRPVPLSFPLRSCHSM